MYMLSKVQLSTNIILVNNLLVELPYFYWAETTRAMQVNLSQSDGELPNRAKKCAMRKNGVSVKV